MPTSALRRFNQLRDRPAGRRQRIPAAERATAESLRQQLHTYRDELKRLRTENQALREQLARHLGTARATPVRDERRHGHVHNSDGTVTQGIPQKMIKRRTIVPTSGLCRPRD